MKREVREYKEELKDMLKEEIQSMIKVIFGSAKDC
jgi:hypothetical protein